MLDSPFGGPGIFALRPRLLNYGRRVNQPPQFDLDTDGVPRGQKVLDALVSLLDLQRIEDNIYRGFSFPGDTRARVFGGQVASQALVAAGRTVPKDRRVHSLHAYFLRPGDNQAPIVYQVERTRDGKSFTTRRVIAIQHGQTIFSLSASFQVDEPGFDHCLPGPEVADPEALPTLAEQVVGSTHPGLWAQTPRPFDLRYVTEPSWKSAVQQPKPGAHSQIWFRADGELPNDDLLHVCLLAYLSDLTLLDAIMVNHGVKISDGNLQVASLDHAMWFHRPIRVDQWLLYDIASPSASGARGLGLGSFYNKQGVLIATAFQEGLVRQR